MSKAALLAAVSYLTLSAIDGKITADELKTAAKTFLDASGVNLDFEFFDIFTEADGDLHLIIKKSLLDKLKIEV